MTYAQTLINELAPKVGHDGINAAGVEGSMRLEYGTLDHLSRQDFVNEIIIAARSEEAEPGYLATCAESHGLR